MRIDGYAVTPVTHLLREPLQTAHGLLHERRGTRLDLQAACWRGHAETLPLPAAGTEDASACVEAIERIVPRLVGTDWEPEELDELLRCELPDRPAARYALDVALLRLRALERCLSVASLLRENPARSVRSHALIGGDTPEALALAGEAAVQAGFSTLKLKVASRHREKDAERVAVLRAKVGPGLRLRLDANGGWSTREAPLAIELLAKFDIDCLEQPLPATSFEALAQLSMGSPIPLAADESLAHPEGRRRFEAGELTPIGVIKPMVLGGLHPAAALADRAARRGLQTFVTTTFDGPCGTDAAFQLAAAHPTNAVHGLATATWMAANFPTELLPSRGRLGARS